MRIEAEANLSALIESTEDLIFSVDPRYRLITFNRAFMEHFERYYGGPVTPGISLRELLPPAQAAPWLSFFDRAFSGEKVRSEMPLVDGRVLELVFNPILVDGKTTGISVFGKEITERKAAEIALKEAEANRLALIESTHDLIWSVDLDYRLVTVNRALQQAFWTSFGIRVEPGMHREGLLPPERAAIFPPLYERALREGSFQTEYVLLDGRTLELTFNPIVVDGKPTGISVFGKEISERKAAEIALQGAEAKYRDIFEGALEGIFQTTFDGQALVANPAAVRMLGYDSPQDYLSSVKNTVFDVWVFPEERARYIRLLQKNGVLRGFECQFKRKDGTTIWVALNSRKTVAADGKTPINEGFIEDITERKKAEMQLRESLDLLQESQEIGGLGSYVLNIETGVWTSSDVLHEVFGIDKEYEHTVAGWTALIHPDDRAMTAAYFAEEVAGKGLNFDKEYRIIRQTDQAVRWVYGIGRLEFDGKGQPVMMRGVIKDITESKLSEMQVRNSEERYRATFEQAAVGLVLTSFDGMILRCNERFAAIIGYPVEEILGLSVRQITAPEDRDASAEVIQRVANGAGVEVLEKRYIRKDGSLFWAKTTVSMQRDGQGRPLHIIAFIEDINERKEAEERLKVIQEALRRSEDRYRTAFLMHLDSIDICRLEDGRYIDVNEAFVRCTGFQREEVIGRTAREIGIWADPGDRQKLLATLRQNQGRCTYEAPYRTRNGELRWGLLSVAEIELDGDPCILSITRDITDAKAAEERLTAFQETLRSSEERYRTVFETSPDAVIVARLSDGAILDVNRSFQDSTGFERDEVIGRSVAQLGLWENDSDKRLYFEHLSQQGKCMDIEVLSRKKNGELFWIRLSASLIEIGGERCRITFAKDISEVKAAEERLVAAANALRSSEERYRTAFQANLDAMIINRADDGRFIDCNQAFLDTSGFTREEVLGRTTLELGVWVDTRDRTAVKEMLNRDLSYRGLEVQFKKKNGEIIWGEMSATLMEFDGVPCILSNIRDLSAAKAAESTIRSLAFYDPLTGLPNRRHLLERLRQPRINSARRGHSQALLLVDLDYFKTLNDTLGHRTGDLLLQEVARRIVTCAREADTVFRLGGDEFVVLLEGLSKVVEEAAAQAEAMGENILAAINLPCLLEERECLSTASIGIAVYGDKQDSTDEILQQAEIALYQAKAAGRNTLRFFSPALQATVNARAEMEEDLRQGIKANQFLLYYQPQVERGRLTGAEALIRWKHPRRGLVQPNDFIPLAEESKLILPLGDWVLEAACTQIALWAGRKETAHLSIAVNISALQFRQPTFVENVLAILSRTGANPGNLRLELTESMLVENLEDIVAKMTRLKQQGLRFSLDDFGTGYSSLSYLKRLPLDLLKIDRSFVRDMMVDATSGAIAQTILSLGRAMGLSVIAEGVETEEQRGYLAALGCHSFQGFLFSRPLPLDKFEEFLQNFAEGGGPS